MACKCNNKPLVKFARMTEDAVIPKYAKEGDAGMDLYALTGQVIPGNARGVLIRTGLKVWLPEEYELQVRDRSGMCVKTAIRIANAPGTVDEGYMGEICIIVDNLSNKDFIIDADNRRIAQAAINHVPRVQITEVSEEEIDARETDRGTGGFGHSGRN